MIEGSTDIKAPVAWLPAGLISWYAGSGLPQALVTSWVALVGGERPCLRTAWHGYSDPDSRLWGGGDFMVNIPYERDLVKIREVMRHGKLCLKGDEDLNYGYVPGLTAIAPRLLDCAVQIECVGGRLIDTGFDAELGGDVARVYRDNVAIDAVDVSGVCSVKNLSSFGFYR